MKKIGTMISVALFMLTGLRLHAQITGCDDSPENPTVVLGFIVGAAGIGFARVRNSLRGRKNPKGK